MTVSDGGVEPEKSLRSFATEIQALSEGGASDVPPTTPDIFGTVRKENVWHSYLTYFIDPSVNHGFGDRFLEAFLEACDDAGAIDLSSISADTAGIHVWSEVGTDLDRRPAVLIYHPDEWFFLLELKVDSPEGESQTADYVAADRIGDVSIGEFDGDSRWYGYVAPTIPNSIAPEFVGVRWATMVA